MPPEVFYQKAFRKIHNIYKKTPVLKSLLNIGKSFAFKFSCKYLEISKNTCFEEHLEVIV